MTYNTAKELLKRVELADSQWVSLRDIASALAGPLDQPVGTINRLLSAHSIESVRPARIDNGDGAGRVLKNRDNDTDNQTLSAVVVYQLSDKVQKEHAPTEVHDLSNGAIVEFTIPALHAWLVSCDLEAIAQSAFGKWMRDDYQQLIQYNLLVTVDGSNNAGNNSIPELLKEVRNQSTLSYEQLKALTGRKTPADVKAWLASNNIPFYTGKRGRPFTMVAAMGQSLGVQLASNDNEQTRLPKRKITV